MSDRPAAGRLRRPHTALTEIRDGYVLDEQRWTDPTEIAEAFRYVGQVLSASSELFWEGDPDHPRFASIVSPARKLQGDNPDAIYHFARIRGDHVPRGRIREQCYASFTVHGQAADGGIAGHSSATEMITDFTIADDGSYEIIFSTTPHDGDWVELHPGAHSIVVRTYYELTTSHRTMHRSMSTSIFGPTIKRRHRSTARRSPPAWRKASLSFARPRWGRAYRRTNRRPCRSSRTPQRRRHTVQLP